MIRHHRITRPVLLCALFFQAGCFSTSVVQVTEPGLSQESIAAKLKSRPPAATSNTTTTPVSDVGVIIELRSYVRKWRGALYGGWREKAEVYATVSTQIMAAFQEAGVAAQLIHDEVDPRWTDIGPAVCVQYAESVRTETSGGGLAWGWEPGPKIPIAVPSAHPGMSPLYMNAVQTHEIITPSVDVTIYNSDGNVVDTEHVISPRGVVETFARSMHIQPRPFFTLSDELKRALAKEPRTAKDFEKRGDAYLAMHEYNTAIDTYESAIRLAPKDKALQSACRNQMGLAYAGLKEWDRALQEYEKAMSCQPQLPVSATIKLNMSIACVNLERYDRALQECEEALALKPPPELSVTIKMHMVKPLYCLKEYKRAAEIVQYLNLRRQELDDLVGREVVEDVLSKAKLEASN
jgi:tetratricopeptide (TPR) repeat protein